MKPPENDLAMRGRPVAAARPVGRPHGLAGARESTASVLLAVRRRDREAAAGVMAAGLAFRLFLVLLPMAMLLAAAVGFSARFGTFSVEDSVRRFGVIGTLLPQMAAQTGEARRARWILLGAGLVLLAYAAHGLYRTLALIDARLWRDPRRPGTAVTIAVPVLMVAQLLAGALASGLASELPATGLPAELGLAVVTFGIWIALFGLLPHQDATLRALLPGAAVAAVALAIFHLATIELYGPWVARPGKLYGALGTIAGLMAWLFIGSRVIVGALTLNVCLWERRTELATERLESGAPTPVAPAP